jgi:hypothetical protein
MIIEKPIEVKGIPMNLQLFAESLEDSFNDSEDTEVADGEEEELEENEDDSEEEESEEEEVAPQKQSSKQDKAFKEYRQRAEQAERAAQQYQQELNAREQWVKQMFSQYGVTNWQDYQLKMETQVKQQREQQLKDAGVDPKVIENIIKNDPEFQAMKQQTQAMQQQLVQKEQEARMVGDYGELTKEYPELVTKPEDIPKEVWNLFDKGYSLLDAYEKVNRKEVREYWSKGAKQKVMNDIKGKSHIKADKANGDEVDSTQIPSDVLEMYKSMMPKKSMKEYIAHYKKNNK